MVNNTCHGFEIILEGLLSPPVLPVSPKIYLGHDNLIHRQQETLPRDAFHLFQKLSLDLQCLIWEYTYPASRVIDIDLYEDEMIEGYTEGRVPAL
jgi:hypothetical protein